MKLSVCTISFRHHLTSLGQIARWAVARGFSGIELWGVHARNLADHPEYDPSWLRAQGLAVPMISDYLPLGGDPDAAVDKARSLCRLANLWGAKKVRTFAGSRGSDAIDDDERAAWTARLRELAQIAQDHGLSLVVETHPSTLADTLPSIVRLLNEVDHSALRLNFDVIHVWESGADPIEALGRVEPVVAHMHFKNIARRDQLSAFAPSNVYSPAGDRAGMVSIFEGAFDYEPFLRFVMTKSSLRWSELEASLEWFGSDVLPTLEGDHRRITELEAKTLGLPAVHAALPLA
ncbi:MAG: sugar phosphate isomerase/epimerase [Myxococcota bacterium]